MNEVHILLTLATVHFIALMSPGPDFALVVQNASRYGRQTGTYIALGLSFGILTHSILSITGVSYLIQLHPQLFALLQLAGGSYLLYLGGGALIATLRHWKSVPQTAEDGSSVLLANKRQAFSKGYLTNLLNPKALVFFVSLMSSLVPVGMSLSGKGMALVILWSLSFGWFAALAWLLSSAKLQQRLQNASRYIDLLCGTIFSVIGITLLIHVIRLYLA